MDLLSDLKQRGTVKWSLSSDILSTEIGSSRNEELNSGEAIYSGRLMEGGGEGIRALREGKQEEEGGEEGRRGEGGEGEEKEKWKGG